MKVKYALMSLGLPFPFPREFPHFKFDEATELSQGPVKEKIVGADARHWPEWLGSLTWEALSKNNLLLSSWMATVNPEILDHENQALQNKISTILRVLPLSAPLSPPFEDVFLFSGRGELTEDGKLIVEDIREFTEVKPWRRSYYNEHYWGEFHDWAQGELMRPETIELWNKCYQHYDTLFVRQKSNRQLFESFRSFDEAMQGSQLEFKIPNLVRAIECVVHCYGYKEFATRTLQITGLPRFDIPYSISTDTEELLQNLYQLRNDCSHGKPFAYSLEKKLGGLPDGSLVARYEFLAEWAARAVLNGAFINPKLLEYTRDRTSLEDAWNHGHI